MSAILEQYKLWVYYTTPTSSPNIILDVEIVGKAAAQQAIIEPIKISLLALFTGFKIPIFPGSICAISTHQRLDLGGKRIP
jgi:hypothetical protein